MYGQRAPPRVALPELAGTGQEARALKLGAVASIGAQPHVRLQKARSNLAASPERTDALKDITAEFGSLDLDRFAFFFDFDGTLTEIAPRPQEVTLSAEMGRNLVRLVARTHGAVAIITGRNRHELSALVASDMLIAGMHGLDFPGAAVEADPDLPARIAAVRPLLPALETLVSAHPGALLEDKGQGLALHWRGAPDAETALRGAADGVLAELGAGWRLQPGKCVAEIRPVGDDKGTALRRFLALPAFRGRRPIAFGDDLNDQPMLDAAREAGGIAVALGHAAIDGDLRLAGPEALAAWLGERLDA